MKRNEVRLATLDRLTRALGAIVSLIGVVTLLGWALEIRILKSGIPGLVEMKPNTAACFILAGVSLELARRDRTRALADACSGLTIAVGLATMSEYAFGWNWGIDELLFEDRFSEDLRLPRGRMALASAAAFALTGTARMLATRGKRLVLAQSLVFIAVLFPLFSFLAYLFGDRLLTLASPYTSLAINTVFAFFALGAGILCECSGQGPMAIFVADDPGGYTLRRLLPISVGLTILFGFLGFLAARAGWYSHEAGNVIFSIVTAVALSVVIWENANALSRKEVALSRERERFRLTLASIGDAVIATDRQGRILFMNRIAEVLTGWTHPEADGLPIGTVFRIVDETNRIPAANSVDQILASGHDAGLANRTILIARDGGERPIDENAAPIQDASGETTGVVLVFHDVSENRLAEQERERLLAELRATDARKDEFLAMLAHELRNPLAAIGNAVQVTSLASLPEPLDWSMEVITRQIRHLTRLIDDLLDVSRISRGKIELRRDVIDASTILRNAVATVKGFVDERKHRLEVELGPDKLWVEADSTRLEQVFVNLLNNAAKYNENGGTIRLWARREEREVVFGVEDSGMGMLPENIQAMFELFAQGNRSLARSEGGLGIGLTVVKKLVELHGGTVTAESGGLNQGSRFTIRLPSAPQPTKVPIAPDPTPSTTQKSRILVVDDHVDTARGMARLLKLLGHEVVMAHDGPEAVRVACETRPQFILLDIGLPGMSGYEVAMTLRNEDWCRDTMLIAISGYGKEEDRRRSKESGIDHHLIKPLDHQALLVLLSTATRNPA